MKRRFFFLLILAFMIQKTFCQCKAYVDVAKIVPLYDISAENYKKNKGYIFPEFFNNDSIIFYAYKPFVKKDDKLKWEKIFINELKINIDSTNLYMKCYATNVEKIRIEFETDEGKIFTYEKRFEFNKYQLPIFVGFSYILLNSNKDTTQIKIISIRKFILSVFPNKTKQKYEFAIADFKISSIKIHSVEFNHPFFCQIKGEGYIPTKNSFTSSNKIELFSTFSDYCWDENAYSSIYIKNDSTQNTDYSIKSVFKQVFDKYPFYNEKNINKDNIVNHFENIYKNDSISGTLLWDSLRSIVQTFNDPHFSIPFTRSTNKNDNQKKLPPFRIQEFYDRFYISAIFDTTLIAYVKPGMEIIRIDDIPVQTLINEKIKKIDNEKVSKKIEIINDVLYRNIDDSVKLSLTNVYDTIHVSVMYKNKPVIPDNFKPQHASFKFYENEKIIFFRINNWTLDLNTYIYNNIDKIEKANGLIFDLRNNGGGDNVAVTRIASLFIKEPKAFSHSCYVWDNDIEINESQVIKPHPLFDLTHMAVVILINKYSLCASESFLDFMKMFYEKLTLIGSEKTNGNFASVYTVYFEDGKFCKINSLVKIYPASDCIREGIGYTPDIWVTPSKIADLAPYNDKVLQTALEFLKNKIKTNQLSKKRY